MHSYSPEMPVILLVKTGFFSPDLTLSELKGGAELLMHKGMAGRGTSMTIPGVFVVELTPVPERWPHLSLQSISEFGGDGSSPHRDPHLGAWTHQSLPLSTWA